MYTSSKGSIAQTLFVKNTLKLNRGLHISQKIYEDIHGFTHKNVRRMKKRDKLMYKVIHRNVRCVTKLPFSLEGHV